MTNHVQRKVAAVVAGLLLASLTLLAQAGPAAATAMRRVRRLSVRAVRSRPAGSRPVRAGLLAVVAVSAAVFAAPSPSMAAGDQFVSNCQDPYTSCQDGTLMSGAPSNPDRECWNSLGTYHDVSVCIVYYGDIVYVRDNDADGHSVIGQVDSEVGNPYTTRLCRNHYGSGTWVRCDFNWDERGWKYVYGGEIINSVYYNLYFGYFGNK